MPRLPYSSHFSAGNGLRLKGCNQSGVMFGLDARIALAIFGALAVVVGYISFGRVETARTAALIAELEAFENATNAYAADMGTFPLFTLNREDLTYAPEDIDILWQTSGIKPGFIPRWRGPYLHRESRKHNSYGLYSISFATPDRKSPCAEDTACAIWLSLSQVPTQTWQKVNSYYDEANGSAKEAEGQQATVGRVQAEGSGNALTLYFRLTTRPQQP